MDTRSVGPRFRSPVRDNVTSARGAGSTRVTLPELPPRDVVNWNGKIAVHGRTIYKPTSVAQIIAIMKKESAVRAGGGLHSFNTALVPARGGAFIDMTHFNRIETPVKHPDGTFTVRVQPGATVRDVSTALAAHGLALENLPTSEKITIGGATANGAHGSGLASPAVLAEQIAGMSVVTSDGVEKQVAKEDLPLYRINMGLLGLVTGIELRCVPDFDLRTNDDKLLGDAIIAALEPARLRADLGGHQSVTYLVNQNMEDPSATQLIRRRLTKVTKEESAKLEAAGVPRKSDYDKPSWINQQLINQAYGAAAAASGKLAQQLKAKLRDQSQPYPPRLGRSALMYQVWLDVPAHDVSYGVPLEKAQETLKRVMSKMRALGYESPVPLSLRFLRGTDTTLMGMNSGRDTVVFELLTHVLFDDPSTGQKRAEVQEAEAAFEQIMREMGGRPHWGKEFIGSPKQSFDAGAWQRFADERKAIGAKLDNAWARNVAPT